MTDTKASAVYVPPVIEHSEWDASTERLDLFTITKPGKAPGDDNIVTDYSMPNKPNVGLALGYLRYARLNGSTYAMSWLLEEAAGADAYDALVAEPDLDPEDLGKILVKVRDVVLGGLNAPKD